MTITINAGFNLLIISAIVLIVYIWARVGAEIAKHFYADYNLGRGGWFWSTLWVAPLDKKLVLLLWWPWFVGAGYLARREGR